jgi:hypothetical protein
MTEEFAPFARLPARLRLVALDDRRRLPWRFLSRHIALDALSPRP